MLGAGGFDWGRLFREPGFRRLSEAAVAAASRETAAPLVEALGRPPTASAVELAAFAAAFQGVAAEIALLPDAGAFPPELGEFLRFEAERSRARAETLLGLLAEASAALTRDGIDAVALKGAALLLSGLAGPGRRPMGDLDLLLADPGRMDGAARALAPLGWRTLFDTRRHRVLARETERVVRPGCEDPGNPVRIELHYALRIPVLGRTYDLTDAVLAAAEPAGRGGICCRVSAGNALRRHLLVHAAEDFAATGLRGIQAADFRLLSRSGGPVSVALPEADRRAGVAPLAYAALAVERLFPGSFDAAFLESLRAGVPAALRERAATIPPLRRTRPPEGWTRTALALAESPGAKARFFLRTALPPPEEVRVNVAPEATGLSLLAVWLRLFGRRVRRLVSG
ncbi:MAG TPA: nucleotidyltransferase family protein [Thermoanaerobaculia bacterium]|nr:nucleotidyltransferase family protein [Thermoanaerobaculia bacterium]